MTITDLENSLTTRQKAHAFDIMRSHGWDLGSQPPEWCWRIVFEQVKGEKQ